MDRHFSIQRMAQLPRQCEVPGRIVDPLDDELRLADPLALSTGCALFPRPAGFLGADMLAVRAACGGLSGLSTGAKDCDALDAPSTRLFVLYRAVNVHLLPIVARHHGPQRRSDLLGESRLDPHAAGLSGWMAVGRDDCQGVPEIRLQRDEQDNVEYLSEGGSSSPDKCAHDAASPKEVTQRQSALNAVLENRNHVASNEVARLQARHFSLARTVMEYADVRRQDIRMHEAQWLRADTLARSNLGVK